MISRDKIFSQYGETESGQGTKSQMAENLAYFICGEISRMSWV